ncbi:MAG TPA: hypothetical protein VGE43_14990 [Acidimicrobiales bacterium]
MTEPLDPLAADEVLRRAAEISAEDHPVPVHGGYDRRSLTDAASEVGIDRRAVELALAEHDAGILRPADARGGLLGPSRVLETRVVSRTVPESSGHITHWLRSQLLHRNERHGSAEVWRPRDDLGAKLRRKVDARTSRKVRLGDVDAVEASVVDCGEGRSLVRLEVVFDDMRRGLRTGVVVVPTAVAPVLGVAAAALTGEIAIAIGALPLGGALGAVGTVAGRRTLADQRERARRALCSFLDDLEDR